MLYIAYIHAQYIILKKKRILTTYLKHSHGDHKLVRIMRYIQYTKSKALAHRALCFILHFHIQVTNESRLIAQITYNIWMSVYFVVIRLCLVHHSRG